MLAHVDPKWERTRHHAWLSDQLADRVAQGDARIIIHAPPRTGKSVLVSKGLPAWVETVWPEWPILFASYEASFAGLWGRRTRDLILSHPELGVRLRGGRQAPERSWETLEGGGMHTAGVGGPFTGRGGKLLIVDDPIKNAREAMSATMRDGIWEWWQTTAYTRLEPGASAIVMMTRWHPDDLAGRLLQQTAEGGEPWEYWKLSAIAEENDILGRKPGEALWPERFPIEWLRKKRTGVGILTWEAMYGGNPRLATGGMFHRDWFAIVAAAPRIAWRIRSWDLASVDPKKPDDPDWTVGVLLAFFEGVLYVEHVIRVRRSPGDVDKLIAQTARLDGVRVTQWFQEDPGQAGVAQVASIKKMLRGLPVKSEKKTGDKVTWADPLSSQAEAGNVKLVEGPWVKEFLDEFEAFPFGRKDDQVDATSWGASRFELTGRMLGEHDDAPADTERPRRRDVQRLEENLPRGFDPAEPDEDDDDFREVR